MKFLSVRSARAVAILLTFVNAIVFIYFGNKYGLWIEIGLVCLILQVLVLIFYLLVHIYFVWLNEQMLELENSLTHKTNALESKLSVLNDKNSELSNSISKLKEEVENKIEDHSDRLLSSVSEQSEIVIKQNQELRDEISNAYQKTNGLLTGLSNDFEKSHVSFSKLLHDKINELNDKFHALVHGISQEIQINLRRNIRQIGKESNENHEQVNSKLNSFNSKNSIVLNQLHDMNIVLGSMQVDLFPSLKNQLDILNRNIAKSDQVQKLFDELFQAYNENNIQINGAIEKNHQESIAMRNRKQEDSLKLMAQLSSKLEEAVSNVSPKIVQEIKPTLDEIVEAEGTKKTLEDQLKHLNDSIIAQLNSLGQINEDLQKSTLQTLNAAFAELDSLIDNNFTDFNVKSKKGLQQFAIEMEKALETKLNQKLSEIVETSASEQMVKAMHDQLMQEVNLFKENYSRIEEYIEGKSKLLQNTVLESNSSIKTIKDHLGENTSRLSKHAFDSNTILKKIEELDVAMENAKETKLLKQFISSELNSSYERIDSLFSIHSLLNINSPLPVMHEWRISSDFATHLVGAILKKGKGNVVDIGSGISTILAGYALRKNGQGKVIALEHSEEYYKKSLALIKEHKLEDYCNLYLCPLKKYVLNNKEWLWYDISKIKLPNDVILINVDGPPGATQVMARYPAVPILKDMISKNTVVLLDDGKREDEKKIADAWEEELSLKKEFIKNYKGLYELTK